MLEEEFFEQIKQIEEQGDTIPPLYRKMYATRLPGILENLRVIERQLAGAGLEWPGKSRYTLE